jgi:hypothetical protein
MRVNYPPAFVVMACRYIAEAAPVDWSAAHDEFLLRSIDTCSTTRALSELLHYSPGAVTHEEQDLLCLRLDDLIEQHIQRRKESEVCLDRPRG